MEQDRARSFPQVRALLRSPTAGVRERIGQSPPTCRIERRGHVIGRIPPILLAMYNALGKSNYIRQMIPARRQISRDWENSCTGANLNLRGLLL